MLVPTPQVTEAHEWMRFVTRSGLPILEDAREVAVTFAPEIRRYCELIQAPGGAAVGVMFRGEDASFTERVQALLGAWGMAADGVVLHSSWAELFEHKRAFLKLEWHRSETSDLMERLVAFYFRRRPSVQIALERLRSQGVALEVLEQVAQIARLLGKESVHFVAAALRPDHPIHHKFYFSQYLTPNNPASDFRLLQILEQFKIDASLRVQLIQYQRTIMPADRAITIFISCSFTDTALVPSFKIDYPDLPAHVCAALLPHDQRTSAESEITDLCGLAGITKLSYLGVRLTQSGPLQIKYYADSAK